MSAEQQLKCEACGVTFKTKEEMMEHSKKVHGGKM
jgi:uncharacterized C2H2 Zn-finger protein